MCVEVILEKRYGGLLSASDQGFVLCLCPSLGTLAVLIGRSWCSLGYDGCLLWKGIFPLVVNKCVRGTTLRLHQSCILSLPPTKLSMHPWALAVTIISTGFGACLRVISIFLSYIFC